MLVGHNLPKVECGLGLFDHFVRDADIHAVAFDQHCAVGQPDLALGLVGPRATTGQQSDCPLFYSWIEEEQRAQACIECGECLRSTGAVPVEKCPQHIDIPEWLQKAHAVLCQEETSAT